MEMLRRIWQDEDGQDLAEYGLLLILIAVAIVTAIALFSNQIINVFNAATNALTGA